MIYVKNISKTFNNKKVINEINIEINRGEIVSIIGPSDIKTTLLNIISTLEIPDPENNSEILIDNTNVLSLNDSELSKFRLSNRFYFSFHELLPEFTAIENVIIPALIKGENKKDSITKAKEILRISKNFLI